MPGLLRALTAAPAQVDLSTRPGDSVGSDEIWEQAESALKEALGAKGWAYELNEGDGAFYGKACMCQLGGSLPGLRGCGRGVDQTKCAPLSCQKCLPGQVPRST